MSLSTYYLEYGGHLARLRRHRRRRRRCRTYAPTSNAAGHDNHEKINSWVFLFLPLGGPSAPLLIILCLPTRSPAAASFSVYHYLQTTTDSTCCVFFL